MTNLLNGKVITDFKNYDQGFSIIIQPDGKFLVAGYSGFRQHYKLTLARYDNTGKLDKSFSTNGVAIDTKETYWGYNADVAIQNDGEIIVSGEINGNFHLLRYNNNGILDANFNQTGEIIDDFGGLDFPAELAIQPDQKILVVGVGESSKLTIVRYTSNGLRDISFGNNGLVSTDFGAPYDYGTSLDLQPDGKIIVTGFSHSGYGDSNFIVARYNTDGSLDKNFNKTGKVITDFGSSDYGQSITLQPDGKILAAGYSGQWGGSFALSRYNADGSLDSSFGNNGKVLTNSGNYFGNDITLQSDGKILLAGHQGYFGGDFILVRFNTNGNLDNSFGVNGFVTTNFGGNEFARSIALQKDGKILVA